MAEVEQVFAGKVLGSTERIPEGEVARDALVELLRRGTLFREATAETRRRLDARRLAAQLSRLSAGREHGVPENLDAPPEFDAWIAARVLELGITSGDEVGLLSPHDFLTDDLPFELRSLIDDLYPTKVDLGDVLYRVEFDLEKRQAILNAIRGGRTKPPTRSFLPRFPGLKVFAEAGRRLHAIR